MEINEASFHETVHEAMVVIESCFEPRQERPFCSMLLAQPDESFGECALGSAP